MVKNEKQAGNNAKHKNKKRQQGALSPINIDRIKMLTKGDEKIPADWIDIFISQFLS